MSDLPDLPVLTDAFEYLDELRASGRTNMFGARPYLVREGGLGDREAGAALSAWMKTFDPSKSPASRAAAALGEA